MAVGAVAVAPFSLAAAGPALFSPAVLAAGAAVAALSSLLPYALEAISLRRLPSSTFAVLMSLAPAVAATTGAVLLDQPMDAISALAIACVVAASAGAVATSVRRPHHDHQSPRPSAQPSSPQDRRAVA
jgi:inner membrane transporter RhtA